MDTNKDTQELEQMRQQMDILKRKLEQQEIVNDQIIRQSMKSRMSWINRYRWISLFAAPFVALCFIPSMFSGIISWQLYIFTIIMVLASTIADFVINRISDNTMMNSSLIEISEKLTKMKRLRRMVTIIGLVVVVFWLIWLLYEIYATAEGADLETRKYTIGFMIAVGIGAFIGGAIGLTIYFKMQSTNDDIIRQIEELKRAEQQNGQII